MPVQCCYRFLLQSAGLPWTIAKGQDTFTPISSAVRIALLIFDAFLFVTGDILLYVYSEVANVKIISDQWGG